MPIGTLSVTVIPERKCRGCGVSLSPALLSSRVLSSQDWCSLCSPVGSLTTSPAPRRCRTCGLPFGSAASAVLADRDQCWTCENAGAVTASLVNRKLSEIDVGKMYLSENTNRFDPNLTISAGRSVLDDVAFPAGRMFSGPSTLPQSRQSTLDLFTAHAAVVPRPQTLIDLEVTTPLYRTTAPMYFSSPTGGLNFTNPSAISLDLGLSSYYLAGAIQLPRDSDSLLWPDRNPWRAHTLEPGLPIAGYPSECIAFPGSFSPAAGRRRAVAALTVTAVSALAAESLSPEASVAVGEYVSLLPRLNRAREDYLGILTAKAKDLDDLDVPQIWTMSRVKSASSMAAKTSDRGWTGSGAWLLAKDAIGLRVVCATTDDAYRLASSTASSGIFTSTPSQRDYLATSATGYHAIHLQGVVRVDFGDRVQHTPLEVQIQPAYFAAQALVTHDLVYKQPWLLEHPEIRASAEKLDELTRATQRAADKLLYLVQERS